MRINPLRSMVGRYGRLRRGVPAVIDDRTAAQLVARGLAVPMPRMEAAGKAPENPTKGPRRTGGQGGAAKRSASSPEARAPESSRSRSSGGGRASSRSTKDGD